ncbi:MAG: HEAT repeat domain-containing protein, partial [Undibacterium sp.]|nr:HEAT repeat domain-containing protein [Undibacterium sp.]
QIGDEDAREKLRKLIREQPLILHQLIGRYDKETNVNARQLIVSLLSSVEKPEVLAFSKRLATSADMAQRQDGLGMMQNLSVDLPELHPILLQTMANEKTPALILLTLGALKPPAPAAENSSKEARAADVAQQAAIVTQLQNLSKNIDPEIRLQSVLQLAQWDKADSSAQYWAQALADSSSQVRQAAVTGIAQSGTQSDKVKTALISMANNPNEAPDTRGNALQVLERFKMNEDEAEKLRQLRAQVFAR